MKSIKTTRRALNVFQAVVIGLALMHGNVMAQSNPNSPATMETPFEASGGVRTPEYQDGLRFYETLAERFPQVQIKSFGRTDSGRPLHLVLVSVDQDFDVASQRRKGKSILLINNAIHPGESDGVDASMLFLRDLLHDQEKYRESLSKVMIGIIPYYNIGGALNRNQFSRANQNGPEEYGFRGNARNYDLNRDFIKCDTRNALTFAEVFHFLDPDLFIDTHVSNGADYQHVMTTSHSQKDKLGGKLGEYLDKTFEPALFGRMEESGFPTIPYVNHFGDTPDKGFSQFLESPRYSTGYAALFQTMGFMTETHMLKPYPQRVEATRLFLRHSLDLLAEKGQEIQAIRNSDRSNYPRQTQAAIGWKPDFSRSSKLRFLGYEGSKVKSKVTVGDRIFYDRNKPFERQIDFYNHFVPSASVELPAGYVIPSGWHRVIRLMEINGIEMTRASKDMQLNGEVYMIQDVKSRKSPYEGHYFHDQVVVEKRAQALRVKEGDVLISLDQPHARYVVETLEPEAMDSLFRWNYFDTVLERKEYYSGYVFEETAEQMLAEDAELKLEFEKKVKDDASFARDRRQQLEFLFQRSRHSEPEYRRYPIFRVQQFPK